MNIRWGKNLRRLSLILSAFMLTLSSVHSSEPAQTLLPPADLPFSESTSQIIVKLRPGIPDLTTDQLHSLSKSAGVVLSAGRSMSGGAYVLKLPCRVSLTEAAAIARKLGENPSVLYAEPDVVMRMMALDNGIQYTQWDYDAPEVERGGIHLSAAWDVTTGSPDVVVAVIDSGVLPHAGLAPNLLPGYDFVSEDRPGVFLTANDGNGRDNDATDPGDWISPAENAGKDSSRGFFKNCGVKNSTWHGTHVSGTIAAVRIGSAGVSGVSRSARILPVRAWGKCGGYASDIVDAARWAAGFAVPGVPRNPNPAQVLNMSLDGPGSCVNSMQKAIIDIVGAGKIVVVSAGNRNTHAAKFSPASCKGVITVAATNRSGGKAHYSNFGKAVTISAPGGETSSLLNNGVLSTSNQGKTVPLKDNYGYMQGTSMAAPHVAGIISLMLSANPDLTPGQVAQAIRASARPFPTGTGTDCTTRRCGAGIIDASAVGQVSRILKLSASDISFGVTELGQTTAAQTFTLSNTNTAVTPLSIGTISLTGLYAGDFIKNADNCSGTRLAPRASCTLEIIFHPSAAEEHIAELLIPSDAVNPLNNVLLSGIGQAPESTTFAAVN